MPCYDIFLNSLPLYQLLKPHIYISHLKLQGKQFSFSLTFIWKSKL